MTAHGDKNGNIITSDGLNISLEELLDTIQEAGYRNSIQIILDVCCAGMWPQEA